MTDKLFTELEKAEELVDFLKEKRHQYYSHYTTLETLKRILESNAFQFTHGISERLNDQHKIHNKATIEGHSKNYIFCLTHAQDESVAMWALYTQMKHDAIRIKISSETLLNWISECKEKIYARIALPPVENVKVPYTSKLLLTDVAYCRVDDQRDRASELKFFWDKNETTLNLSEKEDRIEEFAGIIKNVAWEYEQESRIIISFECEQPKEQKRLYVPLTSNLIEKMEIIKGPSFDEKTNASLLEYLKRTYKINVLETRNRLARNIKFDFEFQALK